MTGAQHDSGEITSPAAPQGAVVSVAGLGQAGADPDLLRAQVNASAVRDTLVEALAAAEHAAAAIRAVLAGRGVPAADATTAGLAVHPDHQWTGEGRPPLVRYRSEHRLEVRLRDLATAGQVLGEALAAAGDDVQLAGVDFEVADEPALQVRAREAAWADARRRAEQYAALAGRALGRVLAVTEPGTAPAPPAPRMLRAEAARQSGPPIGVEPGSVTVTAVVHVSWELR